ncbi:MAG: hypothetical protein KKG84_00430 [Candidatus Omnitrophica bacterium]|nr:hypothetical protein [Candidatus Omnitrophota bacterium]
MDCPMWIDFTRTCGETIGFSPDDTLDFCSTDSYIDCPFYRALNDIGYHCEYLSSFLAHEHFKVCDFREFAQIAKGYCLSEKNNLSCERYKMRKKGETPPSNMLPDGTIFEGTK